MRNPRILLTAICIMVVFGVIGANRLTKKTQNKVQPSDITGVEGIDNKMSDAEQREEGADINESESHDHKENSAKQTIITFHGNRHVSDMVFVIEYTNISTQIYSAHLDCEELNRSYSGEISNDGSIVFSVDEMWIADYVATIEYDGDKQLGTVAYYALTKEEYDHLMYPDPVPRDAGPDPFYQ